TPGPESNIQEVYAEQQNEKRIFRFKINNQPIQRNKYTGLLPIVSFLPQDLNLLTRSPGNRRRFMDESLSFISAEYRFALSRFEAVVRQRNELWQSIRQKGAGVDDDLVVWDEKLAEHGSTLIKERQEFFKYLNSNFSAIMNTLSPQLSSGLFAYYYSGSENKAVFMEKILEARGRERVVGTTIIGPHRDDFDVILEGKNAVGFVSRGQMRSFTLALKILERNYLSEKLAREPLVILDDVFSEFDQPHQERLVEFLKSLDQVFVTTTHLDEIKSFLPAQGQIYNIEEGKISNV
ncbi:MAG: DNA replication and repair protein RecF, partial [Candidatus Doudnabacteria bacterium]|nr:DNA replication and repair protein RecF [Candidatus Doudnabacteria bacterium]